VAVLLDRHIRVRESCTVGTEKADDGFA